MHSGADGSRFGVSFIGEKALKMNNYRKGRQFVKKSDNDRLLQAIRNRRLKKEREEEE